MEGVFGRGGVCVWAGKATFYLDNRKFSAAGLGQTVWADTRPGPAEGGGGEDGPWKATGPCSSELGLRAGAWCEWICLRRRHSGQSVG